MPEEAASRLWDLRAGWKWTAYAFPVNGTAFACVEPFDEYNLFRFRTLLEDGAIVETQSVPSVVLERVRQSSAARPNFTFLADHPGAAFFGEAYDDGRVDVLWQRHSTRVQQLCKQRSTATVIHQSGGVLLALQSRVEEVLQVRRRFTTRIDSVVGLVWFLVTLVVIQPALVVIYDHAVAGTRVNLTALWQMESERAVFGGLSLVLLFIWSAWRLGTFDGMLRRVSLTRLRPAARLMRLQRKKRKKTGQDDPGR